MPYLRRLLLIIVAAASTSLVSGQVLADGHGKLVGTWKVVKAEGPDAKSSMGLTYVFNKDGTMKVSWNKGKWQMDGAVLKFLYGPKGNIVVPWDVAFQGADMVVLTNQTNRKQVFTLKRQ